jgi:outer membrane protein
VILTQSRLTLAATASLLALAAPAQADTLREALVGAYNTNPTLEGARANQRATDEGVPIQRAQGLPSANVTATQIEFLQQSANAFTAPDRNLGVNAQLLVPVYSGGAIRNGIAAAKERVEAGQADLRNTESTLFAQVVAAYMDVLRTEALAALTANNVAVLRTNLEATSDRFQIGDLTITDVAQSRSRLAVAEGDFQLAEANLIAARETYIRLVGRAPGELEAPPPLPGLPDGVGEAIVTALENNPNLIGTKLRAEAAGFDTKVAGAGRLPTISVFVNGDYSDFFGTLGGSLANQPPDPNDPNPPLQFAQSEKTANAGIRVTIPLFQGGLPAARQRQAGARESAALEDVIAAERQVIAETRSTYSNWQAANAVSKSAQAAVEAAELSLEGVRAENSIGNRTILDVLNAEQELVNARAQLVTARRNAYVAGFNMLALMGRAEARDLNLDTGGVLYDPQVNADRVSSKLWDWDRDPEPAPKSTRTVDIPAPDATIGPQLLPGE